MRLLLLAMLFIAAGCVAEPSCETDAECVPASCCHARDATHQSVAPDCTDLACTEEYIPCTTDDPEVRPICSLGTCEMARPAWCPFLDALDGA